MRTGLRVAGWLLVVVAAVAPLARTADAAPDAGLVGHYGYEGPQGDSKQVVIDLDVTRDKGGRLAVSFGGGHADGSGAAPDGGGSGTVDGNGVLRFDYEDSFSNRGTGTLRRTKNGGYLLNITIKDVREPRCLTFYGEHFVRHQRHTD